MDSEEIILSFGKSTIETWEAVAAIQIMQATGKRIGVVLSDPNIDYLFHAAGFRLTDAKPTHTLRLDEAFRSIDGALHHDMTYQKWLAHVSGIELARPIVPPFFPRLPEQQEQGDHIVFCPVALAKLPQIPGSVWRAVVRFLRTYGAPVYMMGDTKQRADGLNFTEGTMASDFPIYDKLRLLMTAKLVVGVPNAWTWMASAWDRSISVYYPDGIPSLRWFGFYNSPYFGRVNYLPYQVQIPLLLSGLRQMLYQLPVK